MNPTLERIRRAAQAAPRRLLLAEAGDPRVVGAAGKIARDGVARVTLIGDAAEARATARRADHSPGGFEVRESADPALVARTRAALSASRGSKLAKKACKRK